MEQDDYDFDDMNYFDEDIVQALDHVEEVYLSTQRMNSTADDMPANPIIKEELNDTLPVDRSMIDNSLDIYRSERERLLNHKNQVDHTLESTQKQLKEVRNELKYKDQRIDSLKREIAMMKGKVKNAEEIPDTSRKRALLSQHTELLQLYKKPALHPLSRNSPSPMDLSRASSVVPSDYKLSGLSQVTSSLATIKQEMPSGVSNQRTPRITANTLENDTEMEKKRRLQNAILIPYVTRADITNKPISTVNNIDSLTADKLSEYCQQYTRQLIPSNISREASEKLLILANDIAQCIDSRHNFSIAVKQLLSLTGDCLLIYMKEKIDMKLIDSIHVAIELVYLMTSNFKEACMHLYNDHKLVHPNSILDTLIGYLPLLKFTKANPVWSHKIHNSPIGQQLSKMNCAEVKQFCMESGIPIECIEECITMIPTEKLSPTVTSILRIFHDITMCIDHPIYKQNILDQPSFIQLLSPDVPFMVIRHSLRLIQCLLQYNSSSLQFKNPSAITDLIEHFTTLLNMPKSIINQNEVNILSTEILAVLDRILLISNNSPIAGKIFELVMRLLYSEELRVNGIKILIRTHTQVELDPDVIFRQRIMGSLLYLMSTIILARPDIIRNNKSYTPYSLYFYVQKLLSYKDQVISSGFEETIDLLESSQSALANLLK